MESPSKALTLSPPPLLYSSPSRRTRISTDSANSPEFEFWNTNCNNPGLITSSPLHSADELFSDGFILPLCSISKPGLCDLVGDTEPGSSDLVAETEPGSCDLVAETEPGSSEPSAHITSNGGLILTASKRWKEIFKRGSSSNSNSNGNGNGNEVDGNKIEKNDKKKEKDRKKNSGSGSGLGSGSTELNINIWPFSRSRSAGNNTTRPNKSASSNRKVSSAPCSRSNSSGESKSLRRAWPSSPGRAGVHLGRASPVWQVKRAGPGNRAAPAGGSGSGGSGGGNKVASKVKVPVCIGYRQHLSCRSGESGVAVGGGGSGGGGVKGGGGNGSLFGFRGLFSKKLTDALTV